jgi:phage terminase small subunit
MRKRQSEEHLKLVGGYRADRHDRKALQTDDDPKPMAPLEGEALKAWEVIVPTLIELRSVSSLDSCELTALCEWWATYRSWAVSKENAYKRTIAMAASYKQFRGLAAKFYLTPSDRVGMPCGLQTMDQVRRRTDQDMQSRELEDLLR